MTYAGVGVGKGWCKFLAILCNRLAFHSVHSLLWFLKTVIFLYRLPRLGYSVPHPTVRLLQVSYGSYKVYRTFLGQRSINRLPKFSFQFCGFWTLGAHWNQLEIFNKCLSPVLPPDLLIQLVSEDSMGIRLFVVVVVNVSRWFWYVSLAENPALLLPDNPLSSLRSQVKSWAHRWPPDQSGFIPSLPLTWLITVVVRADTALVTNIPTCVMAQHETFFLLNPGSSG